VGVVVVVADAEAPTYGILSDYGDDTSVTSKSGQRRKLSDKLKPGEKSDSARTSKEDHHPASKSVSRRAGKRPKPSPQRNSKIIWGPNGKVKKTRRGRWTKAQTNIGMDWNGARQGQYGATSAEKRFRKYTSSVGIWEGKALWGSPEAERGTYSKSCSSPS
jgi:hypothetical protein